MTDQPVFGFREGDRVEHDDSGWTGFIRSIYKPGDVLPPKFRGYSFDQGNVVTVDPVYAGKHQWKAITVTEAELTRVE